MGVLTQRRECPVRHISDKLIDIWAGYANPHFCMTLELHCIGIVREVSLSDIGIGGVIIKFGL